MSSSSSTRLERALELYCEHRRRGGDFEVLLAQHPDLTDLLASFVDDPSSAPEAEGAGFDDFELLREIGRGGVGVVHEARQRSLDRKVALKVLHEPFTANPTVLARFHREAQTLAKLDHPGIVRVFAADATHARPWLAMEWIDGESLATHLERLRVTGHRGDSLRRLVEVIAQVAGALHHAHTAGIVHRDVKPSNILLRARGGAVLGDFGLARDAASPALTRTGVAAGTPHYMAPEHILGSGEACDARSDVFALGATLYECVTLRHAFPGRTTQEVLQGILTREPTNVRQLVPGLPMDLAAIVHMALEKSPDRRYADAAAFGQDLRAFLDLQPVVAQPASRTRRLLRAAQRHPMAAASTIVAGLTLVFASVLLWQWPQVRAAAAAQRSEQFEDAMVLGTLARTGADAEACHAHFRRAMELAPDRDDGLAGLCFAIWHFAGPQAALDELDRRAGAVNSPNLERCRLVFLHRLHRFEEAAALERQLGPPQTPLALWLAAVPLLDQGSRQDLQQADRLLSLAIRTAPRPRLLLHVQWATIQTVLNDPEQRREAAEALLRLWPDNVLALQAAGANLATLDPARALAVLQRAVQLGASDPLVRLNLAIAQLRQGEPRQAAATLALVRPDQGLTEAQRLRAVELARQVGEAELESQWSAEWLRQDPRCVSARRAAARLATHQGNHTKALELFAQCVAAAPGNFELRWEHAFAKREADDLAGAGAILSDLARERPTDLRTHDLLLDIADAQQSSELALLEHERWARAVDTDAAAWQELAAAWLAAKAPDAEERALEAAERADYLTQGKVKAILELRAQLLEELGRRDEAGHVRRRAAAAPEAVAR